MLRDASMPVSRGGALMRALLAGTAFATLPAVLPAVLTGGADVALASCSGSGVSGIGGFYQGDSNDNTITCDAAFEVKGKGGNDTLNLSGAIGSAKGGNGDDTFNVSGGAIAELSGGDDNDTFNINGGAIAVLNGDDGSDTVTLNGGAVAYIGTGSGADFVYLNSGLFGAVETGGGADTISLTGGSSNDDGYGAYIDAGGNDDNFTWTGGVLISFQGGDGDDTAIVESNATALLDAPLLYGGSGSDDQLTFQNNSFNIFNFTLDGWETVSIKNGVLTIDPLLTTTVALTTSEDAGKGLIVESDGGLVVDDTLMLTGNLGNAGYVDLQDGDTADQIDVSGDYINDNAADGADLLIDADFTNNLADRLGVGGNLSGVTTVSVNDISGAVITGQSVLVASVGGVNSGSLALTSDLFAGAFQYDFDTIGSDWYLVSSFSPAAPIYDAYGQSLLTLNRVASLQERMGDRRMGGTGDGPAFWGRVSGSHGAYAPTSTTQAAFDQNIWQIETGVDGVLSQNDQGQVIAGLSLRYVDGRSNVSSPTGNGSINSKGGVAGVSLTAMQNDGSYADLQLQAGYFNSGLSSDAWGVLASDLDAWTGAVSLEIGRKVGLGGAWSVTPQTQFSATIIGMDDGFTGPVDETVSFSQTAGVTWRNGLSIDWSNAGANGVSSLHGVANLVYTLAGDTTATVSGFDLASSSTDNLSGEIGLGGTHSWAGGKYALTGQVTASTGLGSNAAEDYRIGGSLGFSVKW